MPIARTVHQLWKTADVPARFTALRESWRRRNPEWEIRLWTDADLETLVAARFPELLAIYRGYEHPICRADLGRYLVLETFGGVYADLDCECLAPFDRLVEDAEFLIGLEPETHQRDPVVAKSGLAHLVCPTLIASAASHPFWRHVRESIIGAVSLEGPLNQTGPFMLTRALASYGGAAPVSLLESGLFYPFDKALCWDGSVFDLVVWEKASRGAYAAHYWDGGWFRDPTPLDGLPWTHAGRISPGAEPPTAYPADPTTLAISCLIVAGDGLTLAVESYRRQTHPNRELVIAAAAGAPDPLAGIEGVARDDIRVVRAETTDSVTLWATAVKAAGGALLCRWNAGELQDPRRLEIQLTALTQTGAQASLLARRVHWRPDAGRVAIGPGPADLGSLMCQPRFWPADVGDETTALRALAAGPRLSLIDLPRLSLCVWPAGEAAFETFWSAAPSRFEGARGRAVIEELGKRLPVALAEPPAPPAPRKPSRAGEILVLTPIKDGRAALPRYLELVSRLETAGAPLSIAFMEGDSRDGSYEALIDALPSLKGRFDRIEAYRRHDGLELQGPRRAPAVQRVRRAAIARARNRLLAEALGAAEWVLWLDVDLIDFPSDLVQRLRAFGKDIITPHCILPGGASFDLNTFIFSGAGDDPVDRVDGLFQPPRGKGRLYLDSVADQDLVRVDSVGGTALLVRGDLHRLGLAFPEESHGGYIETEGLAMMAREVGIACWAAPKVIITHTGGAGGPL
ncbi:MAG TPA: glycosyltransferase [Caulobacteraceae bacterium]|nr:glycosyltransferase [Caulobacteraceae bacterium]